MQDLRHRVHRLLALGHVGRAGRDGYVVLTYGRVVDFLNNNASLIHQLADRLLLHRVDTHRRGFPVDADDASDTLGIVNLRNQVNELTRNVADSAGKVIDVMI